MPRVRLGPFDEHEACAYMRNRFLAVQRPLDDQSTESLVAAVGLIPQQLELAASYLQANPQVTVMAYIGALRSLKNGTQGTPQQVGVLLPEASIGLQSLPKEGQLLMQLCAHLAPDFIALPLVYAIVGHKDVKRLSNVVESLEALSLVRVVRPDLDTVGLQIHRQVQACCREFQHWGPDVGPGGKAARLAVLAKALNALMPEVGPVPDAEWAAAKLYAPHVAAVLDQM